MCYGNFWRALAYLHTRACSHLSRCNVYGFTYTILCTIPIVCFLKYASFSTLLYIALLASWLRISCRRYYIAGHERARQRFSTNIYIYAKAAFDTEIIASLCSPIQRFDSNDFTMASFVLIFHRAKSASPNSKRNWKRAFTVRHQVWIVHFSAVELVWIFQFDAM